MMTPQLIWSLVSRAMNDARLADSLLDDPQYRRWLHQDPGNALLVFQLMNAYQSSEREAEALRRERLEHLVLNPERA